MQITLQSETLPVAMAASLFLEGNLYFLQPRKQPVPFHNPRQSKDVSITIPEKYDGI